MPVIAGRSQLATKFRSPAPPPRKRLVWRISERAPKGEWVDPSAVGEPSATSQLPEVSSGGYVMSSFDLLSGTDIDEDDTTIPGELFDELFATEPKPPKKSADK